MASFLDIKITAAGRAAAINAENTGIELELKYVAFGDGFKNPTGQETALVNPIQLVTIGGGSRVADAQVRVWGVWDGTQTGDIYEIGIYTADQVLFGYYSHADGSLIGRKSSSGPYVFYYDWALVDIPANTISILVDTEASVALMMLAAHNADLMAHDHFLRRASVAQEGAGFSWGGLAQGTPDVIELTLPAESLLTSYESGQTFKFIAKYSNTSATALRVGDLNLRSLRKRGQTALVAGDLVAGRVYTVTFDGSNFQLEGVAGDDDDDDGSDGEVFFVHEFIATAGQVNFEVPYSPGSLLVFYDKGIVPPERFTATDGALVTLDAPSVAGKEVVIVTFRSVAASNIYTKPQTYSRSEVTALLLSKQDNLGFVPVQQGGGVDMDDKKIRLGAGPNGVLLAQIDNTPLGAIWTSSNFDPVKKANAPGVTRVSQSVTLTAENIGLVLVDATAADVTITLPSAGAGILDFVIRRVDSSSNRVQVSCAGFDRVKFHTHLNDLGYPFFVLMGKGDFWQLRSDADESWWPMGRMDTTPVGALIAVTSLEPSPGGYGAAGGDLYNRARWPWLWDHAQLSGGLVTEAARGNFPGAWTIGDGAATFRIPAVEGDFIRPHNPRATGVDVGRGLGSRQLDMFKNHNHSMTFNRDLVAGHTPTDKDAVFGDEAQDAQRTQTLFTSSSGGTETRPINIALPHLIKLI